MVTSALAGEGKSFTAINLAMSIAAELDNTVMLIDADVARPSVPRMLGLQAGAGLLDFETLVLVGSLYLYFRAVPPLDAQVARGLLEGQAWCFREFCC